MEITTKQWFRAKQHIAYWTKYKSHPTTTMPQEKQTARKSTGGKAPHRQSVPEYKPKDIATAPRRIPQTARKSTGGKAPRKQPQDTSLIEESVSHEDVSTSERPRQTARKSTGGKPPRKQMLPQQPGWLESDED